MIYNAALAMIYVGAFLWLVCAIGYVYELIVGSD